MGNGSRAFLAGGLGFAVSFLVACGGGNGLLTGGQAGSLNTQLAAISSAVASGQCGAAANAALSFSNQVANLPSTVNTTLVQNLGQGAATVRQLAAKDCQSASTTSSTTKSSSSTPTTTSTTTTTTTTTNPTTTTTSSSTSATTNTNSTSTTVTNPTSTSTSSTTSNGGVGVGGTGTAGNQNGQ